MKIKGLVWFDDIIEKIKRKHKSSVSEATSYKEISEFWDTHDLSEFWDKTKEASFEVEMLRHLTPTI